MSRAGLRFQCRHATRRGIRKERGRAEWGADAKHETTPPSRGGAAKAAARGGGPALVASGFYFTVAARELAVRRDRRRGRARAPARGPVGAPVFHGAPVFDAAAFALFAFQRNDGLGFWQLPGPWADVFRFNVPGATIAMLIYVGGSVYGADRRRSRPPPRRGLRPDRHALPVQSAGGALGRLAHGGDRRRRHPACGSAVSRAGRRSGAR